MIAHEIIGTAFTPDGVSEKFHRVTRQQHRARETESRSVALHIAAPQSRLAVSMGQQTAPRAYAHEGGIGVEPSPLERSSFFDDMSRKPLTVVAKTYIYTALPSFATLRGRQQEDLVELEIERGVLVDLEIARLFNEAADERFEDGVESAFGATLATLIRAFHQNALPAIERILESPAVDSEVGREMLRRIGGVEHEPSKKYRLSILSRNLHSPSARFRYAAALGLAAADEPGAMPQIIAALDSESDHDVQRCLRRVIAQLEDTRRCLSISEQT